MTLTHFPLKATVIVALLFIGFTGAAGDIDKAFKALTTGDYANAVKYLREVLAEEPGNAAANYGMAKYYFSRDNKAHNLDSANIYIKKAVKKTPMNPEDKATKKFTALGVRDYTITGLQKDICNEAYANAEKANTVESYQYFIDNFADAGLVNRATDVRNQLAFIRARSKMDPKMLGEFIAKYPDAPQVTEVKELYEKALYEQTTADKTFGSYKKYIDANPKGTFIEEAKTKYNETLIKYYNDKHDLDLYLEFEKNYPDHFAYNAMQDSIYALATKEGTISSYATFVRNYPKNRNMRKAWEQLYILYTAEATDSLYVAFSINFPDYPDKDKLSNDLELSKKEIKPFQQGDKWGYAYRPSQSVLEMTIPGEYAEAFEFKNGLAAVRVKPCGPSCVYFYIDKSNKRAIESSYNFAGDFNKGHAIVGIGNCEEADSCRFGIIDKRGNYMVPPVYEDLEEETEGLFLAGQNDRYGFINKNGEVIISLKYTNGLPFSQGIAPMALDSNWFFIDKSGRQVFISVFRDVSSFSDSLCAVTQDGENWGYIDMTGNFVIQPIYEYAEDFSGGYGIVSKKEKDPKVKGLTISQRYKIDKMGKVIEKLTAPKNTAKGKTSSRKRK